MMAREGTRMAQGSKGRAKEGELRTVR